MESVPLKKAFCAGRRTFALTLQLVSNGREHTMARLLDRTAELIAPGACRDMVDVMMLLRSLRSGSVFETFESTQSDGFKRRMG